jgi:hypothetical protein
MNPTYKSGSAWATAKMRNKKQLFIVVNLCKDDDFIGILLLSFRRYSLIVNRQSGELPLTCLQLTNT